MVGSRESRRIPTKDKSNLKHIPEAASQKLFSRKELILKFILREKKWGQELLGEARYQDLSIIISISEIRED